MNKLFTLCSAAVVLAATGASAQMSRSNQSNQGNSNNPCACLEQGMGLPMEKKCFPAAYNAPASISVSCGWDFDVFASFLYWYVGQDSLDVAYVTPDFNAGVVASVPGAVAFQHQTWKPGFQAGFGFNTDYDDWVGWVEYTWMHQSTNSSITAPTAPDGTAGVWSLSDWFVPSGATAGAATDLLTSSWKMHMDMLDLFFSRPYYQGTQLTVSPYGGLRALWIRQYLSVNIDTETANVNTNSWAIGPAIGCDTHWLLGMGFRFEGNATGALLYTQYTKLGFSYTDSVNNKVTADYENLNTVRPVAQLGVGLGWGSYLYCQKFYFDITARYDFNYFWSQNMMRSFVSNLAGYDNNIGDLYLHGLTLTARFDF